MSLLDELAEARDALEGLLVDVLGSLVDADEVGPGRPELVLDGPALSVRLTVRDPRDGSHALLEIRAGTMPGRLVAGRLLGIADPTPEDLLDVVAELGNAFGAGVATLLHHPCELSPSLADAADGPPEGATSGLLVGATVFGHPVVLLVGAAEPDQLDPAHRSGPVRDAAGPSVPQTRRPQQHDETLGRV